MRNLIETLLASSEQRLRLHALRKALKEAAQSGKSCSSKNYCGHSPDQHVDTVLRAAITSRSLDILRDLSDSQTSVAANVLRRHWNISAEKGW